MADRQDMFESMYASLRLEAKIDYYLSSLENAYRLLRNKVANNSLMDSIWYNTYELVDEAISKCKVVKSLLAKFRYTGIVMYLSDALSISNDLLLKTESRAALPSHRDNVRILASEIAYEIRKILRNMTEEPGLNTPYKRAF